MTLALYGHHFSSYTQKALIALYEIWCSGRRFLRLERLRRAQTA